MVHLEIGAALLAHLHEEVRVLVEVGGCLDLEVLVRDVVLGRKRKFSPFEACLRVTSTDSTTLEEAELTRATTSLSPEV